MADTTVPAAEPDPSATSLPNDQSVSEKLGGKVVEAAKEPTETPAEEVSKVQEAKEVKDVMEAKASDAKHAEDTKSTDVNAKDKNEKSSEQSNGARNNDHRQPGDRKYNRNKPNDGRYTRTSKSKFDPSSLPETDDADEIRKQVEFYFSDSNLPLDKFLFSQVGGTENNPFSIKQLHTFKRMRRFQPYSAVVNALKESDFLEVTENDEVKRKVPLDATLNNHDDNLKIVEDEAMPRSVYVKGFGEESADTQFAIEAFFAPYGPTRAIRLRRAADRTFKGSVFVEFETEDAAKQFLELDPKPKFYQMHLEIKSKKAYCEQKVQDIKSGKIKANDNNRGNFQRNGKFQNRNGRDYKHNDNRRDNRRSDHKRDSRGHDYRKGEDDRDWRTRRDEDKRKQDRASKKEDTKAVNGSTSEDASVDTTSKKRGRDEENEGGSPVKKTKTGEQEAEKAPVEATAAAAAAAAAAPEAQPESNSSKKRGRDEDGEEDALAKKAKTEQQKAEKSGTGEETGGEALSKKRGHDASGEEVASTKKAKADEQKPEKATAEEDTTTASPSKKRGRDEDGEVETAKKAKTEEQQVEGAT